MYKVSIVLAEHAVAVWPKALPFLQAVEDVAHDRASCAQALDRILKGECLLWLAYREDDLTVVGAMVTRLSQYTQHRSLTVEMLGGDDFEEWIDLAQEAFEIFAKANECKSIELIGRFGWIRKLKRLGWEPLFVTCEKLLDNS